MCLSPKIGEEKSFFPVQKKSNIPKNYSKKNVTKLTTNKNQFSRNSNNKTKEKIKSSRKLLPNHISNSTSNNVSYKNLTNIQKNQLFVHKKSESSINFISFMNQNINPNKYNQKQAKYIINNRNENIQINNSFFNDLSNKENKDSNSKEILINKNEINNKKIIKRNSIDKNKLHKISQCKKSPNTCFQNKSKNKLCDKKIIINLANSPRNKSNINNKTHYYSKNISPTGSRNKVIKSPSNVVADNNPIIKTFHKKSEMEKYNTDTYNIKKNKNKNYSGNMFAIHKIFENNLFCNKMKEKYKKNNLYKKINYRKNEKDEICFGHTMSHSYSNKKNLKNKNNLSNNSLNIPTNLIIFSSNQNNSEKNCLYKSKYNKFNQKSKESLSSNKNENENENNKTYTYNHDKKNEFINIYNINSINKFDNSLYLKIENNYKKNENKEKMNISNNFNTSKENNINDNNEEKKNKKGEIIYNNQDENNKKEKNIYKLKEKENYTPEETHFEVIAFIQKIKHKIKTFV